MFIITDQNKTALYCVNAVCLEDKTIYGIVPWGNSSINRVFIAEFNTATMAKAVMESICNIVIKCESPYIPLDEIIADEERWLNG